MSDLPWVQDVVEKLERGTIMGKVKWGRTSGGWLAVIGLPGEPGAVCISVCEGAIVGVGTDKTFTQSPWRFVISLQDELTSAAGIHVADVTDERLQGRLKNCATGYPEPSREVLRILKAAGL
jgi:hypothetical protein